ncbi:hypothetical protein [uncultured Corynebacterium sp.]|uniref:antitoxin VbhA family protein n=1 Tax=uncultured Corynebacterium sp. TaxID=159447 RepID=UPI0025FF8E44|nr:hypothetical protein [uncultured Corynebacterium sp.]
MTNHVDIRQEWPDLFQGLSESQCDSIVQSVASARLEGLVPTREFVDRLAKCARGEMTTAEYLVQVQQDARTRSGENRAAKIA